jgi:aminobenzoyl-glutamate utilization protein B
MKAIKDKYHLPGTIVVYGGPAEELVASRGYMAKAGLFTGLDAILHDHVASEFGTSYGLDNFGVVSVQYDFKGRQAHAARPWQGRSALDGVELFDAGIQFMREHAYDPDDVRVQNVIPKGGVSRMSYRVKHPTGTTFALRRRPWWKPHSLGCAISPKARH